jgi:deoxyribose-phosphate aldolase
VQEPIENPQAASETAATPPPPPAYEDLAHCVGLPLVEAALSEEQVFAGCGEGNRLDVGEVLVRPADVDLARNWVEQGTRRMACLTGFPGGSSTTAGRLYEARDVLRRGVKHLVVTMNLGKLVSRKFLYLESELLQLAESCQQNEATLRLLFEVEQLQQDHVLIGVRLCKRTGANGMDLFFRGATEEFVSGVARYVLHHAREKLVVGVHAPAFSLEGALGLQRQGVRRLLTPQAGNLLAAWRASIDRQRQEAEAAKTVSGAISSKEDAST